MSDTPARQHRSPHHDHDQDHDFDRDHDRALTRHLEALLGRQLRRIRTRFLLHGVGILLFALGGLAVIYYGTDRLLQLPPEVRVLVTLGLTVYLLFLTRRWILYPLGRRFTRGDVAIALEQRFPELHQKLISALQLGRDADTGKLRNQSAAMIHLLLADARAHIQEVPHKQLLNPTQTGKVWAAVAGVALVICLGAADNSPAVRVFLQRVLGLDVAYPRATNLRLILPEGGDYQIEASLDTNTVRVTLAAGGDLPVVVRVEGVVPKQVYMIVHGGRGMARRNPMTRRGENRFRHVFRRIAGDFLFHAAGGDDANGDLTVQVKTLQPPRVETIQALVHYPEYTGMAPVNQVGGTVEALIGSRIQLDITTTADVEKATLTFQESGREPIDLVATTVTDDAGPRTVYRASLLHTQSDRYQVKLLGKAGLTNPHPGTYQLLAVPDHAPVGNVLAPENDNLNVVLPDGIIPVRIEARDDFGLTNATVVVQSDKAESSLERVLFQQQPNDQPTKERLLQDFIDLAQPPSDRARVSIGQTLLITTELRDNRQPEAGITKLTGRQVYVIGETDLLRRVAGHFRRVREAVEQNLRLQMDRHERLLDVLEDLQKGATVPQEQVAITAVEVAQGRIQGAAGRIHTEFMRAFDFHLFNRLDPSNTAKKVEEFYREFHAADPRAQRFLAEFYQDLMVKRRDGRLGAMEILDPILQMTIAASRIAGELAPRTLELMATARVAPSTAAATDALRTAADGQTAIIEVLQELLRRLDDWNEFQDLIDNTRSLRDKQRDIRARTQTLEESKGGQPGRGEKRR
ncbi:MAG: hypothetical protein ACYS5W_06670 [Planctomycetota bacterium]